MTKPFREIDIKQGSKEWKEMRLDYVTASEVPVVFNISPYSTSLQLAQTKLSRLYEETENGNYVFAKGHAVERAARDFLKKNYGQDFPPLVAVSTKHPFLMASLDGFCPKKNLAFEVKLANGENFQKAKNGEIPAHHVLQMQTQMLVTGAKSCIYFTSNLDGESITIDVPANEHIHEEIAARTKAWWDDLLKGILPHPTERDVHDVDDDSFSHLKSALIELKDVETRVEKLKKELKEKYTQSIVRSHGLVMKKSVTKGNVDYKEIPELQGVNLELYRKAPITKVYFQIEE